MTPTPTFDNHHAPPSPDAVPAAAGDLMGVEGWTPTDEDWFRAREAVYPIQSISSASDAATRVLLTIGPIVARERRAAQVEALREVAVEMDAWGASGVNQPWLTARADGIERGAS